MIFIDLGAIDEKLVQLGIKVKRAGRIGDTGYFIAIEHPDGAHGVIRLNIACDAAKLLEKGASDRAIREFLYDNTIFRR